MRNSEKKKLHHVAILPNGMVIILSDGGRRVRYLNKGVIQWDGPREELPKAAEKAFKKYRKGLHLDLDGPFCLWY